MPPIVPIIVVVVFFDSCEVAGIVEDVDIIEGVDIFEY
jgi:hypothetical protein